MSKWLQWFVSAGTTILSLKTEKKGPFFHSDEVLTSGIKLTCLRKTWWFSRPKVYSQMKNSFLDFELYFLHFFPMEKWALLFFKLFFQSSGKTIVFPTVGKTIVFPTEWKNWVEFFQPSGQTGDISFEPPIRKSLKMASKIGFLQAKPEPPALNLLVRVWCEQMVMMNSLAC